MEITAADAAPGSDVTGSASPIVDVFELGFAWPTIDPFIVAVHHLDLYPAGDADMGPSTTQGMRGAGDDPSVPGWGRYYGDVVPGFPRHPHRGFETVTLVRRGTVDHSDSLGATARYGAGDVQWLTAGRGIQHAEMFPLLDDEGPNTLDLVQIWLNLPAVDKMAPPSFTMLWVEDLPRVVLKDALGGLVEVTVVAGRFQDVVPLAAPADSWASRADAELAIWQFVAEPSATWLLPATEHPATVRTMYVFQGSVRIGDTTCNAPVGVVLRGDAPVALTASGEGASALILQSRPIGEPVAMGGPFVMNERTEIDAAYRDFRETEFGGWPWGSDAPVHPRVNRRFAIHPDGRRELPDRQQG